MRRRGWLAALGTALLLGVPAPAVAGTACQATPPDAFGAVRPTRSPPVRVEPSARVTCSTGVVLSSDRLDRPIPGARVELWQANANGDGTSGR